MGEDNKGSESLSGYERCLGLQVEGDLSPGSQCPIFTTAVDGHCVRCARARAAASGLCPRCGALRAACGCQSVLDAALEMGIEQREAFGVQLARDLAAERDRLQVPCAVDDTASARVPDTRLFRVGQVFNLSSNASRPRKVEIVKIVPFESRVFYAPWHDEDEQRDEQRENPREKSWLEELGHARS